ncbi:MAG: mandelate racemase/muconate lactonizing enzyme family protein [Bacteroidota bacterium]
MSKQKSRRNFLQKLAVAGAGISLSQTACANNTSPAIPFDWAAEPVRPLQNIRELVPDPVQIAKVEIIRHERKKNRYEYMTRIIAADGSTGYSMGNGRLPNTLTLLRRIVAPFFVGKDARDLATWHEDFYYDPKERVYKYLSMPLWNAYGNIEAAALDLLGKRAGKNVRDLLGKTLRTEIPVYMSSTERSTTAEEEVEWLSHACYETGAEALKFKIGGRMSRNADASPGRTDQIVPLFRKTMGDDFHLYLDSNGSYDVPKAIEIGRWLEEYNIGFFEEPNEWADFVGLKQITDALDITVAGGEQDNDWFKWQWMLDNQAIDLAQPDIMYNGGIMRLIRVANYAAQRGIPVTTHNPRNNAEYANVLAVAAVLPNLGPHQEYRAKKPNTKIPYTTDLKVRNGKVKVLTAPGMGIEYDEEYLEQMEVVLSVDKGR